MHVNFWTMCLLSIGHVCLSEYLICQFNNGTNCQTVLCPNSSVSFICNVEIQQLGFTVWLLPNGTCTNKQYTDRIALLQPKYGGCNPDTSSQHGTCGPLTAQNVASSGCVNSSLSVVATQGLDGTEIRCMNYNGSSYFHVGNATISVIAAPRAPNISVISAGCTEIKVQWSTASLFTDGELTIKLETSFMQRFKISSTGRGNSLTFDNLVSDSLYTIKIGVSNCAGRNETIITSWTLPSPPQDIHASHVINTTSQSMHLVVTWTNQLHAGYNRSYILNVSSEDGLMFRVPQVSMDHCSISSSCYFATDINNINVTFTKYFVSMASVSGPRTGPFSDQVESVASRNSLLTVFTKPSIFTTNITCTFLDGQPYYCLVCCGSDHLSYPIVTVAGRGVVVSAALTNLTSNQVYFCKASAAVTSNGTTCNKFNMANATVEFSFKTNQKVQDIVLHSSLTVQVAVLFQDQNRAVINCTFTDHMSHFCLACCLSDSSLTIANISTFAQKTVTVDLYGLMAMNGSALYCDVTAQNISEASCNNQLEATGARAQSQPDLMLPITIGAFSFITLLLILVVFCLCFWKQQSGKCLKTRAPKDKCSVTMSEIGSSLLMTGNSQKELFSVDNSLYNPFGTGVPVPKNNRSSEVPSEACSVRYSYAKTRRSKLSQLSSEKKANSLYDTIPKDGNLGAAAPHNRGIHCQANSYDYIKKGANNPHAVKMSALTCT